MNICTIYFLDRNYNFEFQNGNIKMHAYGYDGDIILNIANNVIKNNLIKENKTDKFEILFYESLKEYLEKCLKKDIFIETKAKVKEEIKKIEERIDSYISDESLLRKPNESDEELRNRIK
ncbi:hypothetical protein K8O96_12035 [Clostridium sporogenes]|uniref:Uncharacterized protein n=1 Tax=Clostridium botulinum TaxID=1491 RepID=A0A6M0SVB9_CLOBO|nr:hypothetical protein [Clostridium sporogenes]NFA59477.1 hypothetical protein [Clostridium botulinum]NFI74661.1 hypothetical protein [Clostridium sporogenes]NFL71204.1 hypothetical protein [Clostridium sporogenes]NFM26211.1 hypothetical protein [Clostridium sporogenes]NFP62477.1 hypothetical protein [Clostridium sporogenes]